MSLLQRNRYEWIFIILWFQVVSHFIPFLSSPCVCSSPRVFFVFNFSFPCIRSSLLLASIPLPCVPFSNLIHHSTEKEWHWITLCKCWEKEQKRGNHMMWCAGTCCPTREAVRWFRFGRRPWTSSQVLVNKATPLVHSLSLDHNFIIFVTTLVIFALISFPHRTNLVWNFLAFVELIARKWSATMKTFLTAWPRIFTPGKSIRLCNPLTLVWSKVHFPR